LSGLNSTTIIKEQVYTVGDTMNKVKKYILIVIFLSFFFSINISIVHEPYHPAFDILHRTSSIVHPLNIDFMTSLLYAYPDGWSDDIQLTPETPGYRNRPDVGVDRYNNVWVVWDSIFWGNGYVYYSKRDSLGNCLIPETKLPDPMHSCDGQPKVVVDNNGNVHIEWTEPSPTGDGIGYAKLDSSGAFIVPPKLAMPGYGEVAEQPIALNKYSNINVAWKEIPEEKWQISYTKLDSMGDTLISRVRVSPVGLTSIHPGIGVDSFANVHIGYRTNVTSEDSLIYTKLDKNGVILIPYKVLGNGMAPTIIADRNQNIHMVYIDPIGPGNSIKYLKLDQVGNILIGPKTISIHENNNYPHMAMDSLQYLHAVWHLEDPMGIVYTKLDTLGNYVIPPMLVVYPPGAIWPGLPRIVVDRSNRLHLVWEDQREDSAVTSDIFYKRGENETTVREIKRLKDKHLLRISVSPNPFTTKTVIEFRNLGVWKFDSRPVIYDVTGREVRHFSLSTTVEWDGTDDSGNHLPAGVYYIKLSGVSGLYPTQIIFLK
jgi:hypothetical protein